MKIVTLTAALLLLLGTGCTQMYPKFLDDPQVKEAMVEMVRESNKTWEANGSISNPEFEAYYKMGVGVRIIGVDAEMGAAGATGPHVESEPTQ